MFSAMRDKAVEMAVRQLIQKTTRAVKDLKGLAINVPKKTFSVKLELAGEAEPLVVTGSYELMVDKDKTMLLPANIQTSKEWVTILAAELLKGRSFEVPAMARNFL